MVQKKKCRSRQELSDEYLLAKFGIDTAENEPCKVYPLSVYRSRSHFGSRREGGWCHERCRCRAAVSVARRMVKFEMHTDTDA